MKVTDTVLDLKKGVTYKFDMNQCLFDETTTLRTLIRIHKSICRSLRRVTYLKEYDLQSIPDDPFTFQFRVEGSHNIDSSN